MSARRLSAAVLAAATILGAMPVPSAFAQPAPFNPRPTTPYECASMVGAPSVWAGTFWGRKEVNQGFIRYRTTRVTLCFVNERDCRNWLYNMQSEYSVTVWRAECRPGLG